MGNEQSKLLEFKANPNVTHMNRILTLNSNNQLNFYKLITDSNNHLGYKYMYIQCLQCLEIQPKWMSMAQSDCVHAQADLDHFH